MQLLPWRFTGSGLAGQGYANRAGSAARDLLFLSLRSWIPLSSDHGWWVGDGDQLDRLFGNVLKLASDFASEADPLPLTGEKA